MNPLGKICRNRVLAFTGKAEGTDSLLAKVNPLLAQSHGMRASRIADLPRVEKPVFTELQRLLLLTAIVESSNDAIFCKTLDGTILSWNKAAEKMYGYRSEEIVGKPVSILLPLTVPMKCMTFWSGCNEARR
jgi:PAS domain-containing protein